MRNTSQKLLLIAIAICLSFCIVPSALATDVSVTLTSAGTTVLDGVYVGVYTATINGVSTPVICDDYADNTYDPESWTASVSTFANLSSTLYASQPNDTMLYDEAAWLIEQMLSPTNADQVGEIQYAIWGVFDSTAISDLTNYNAADGAIAQEWLNAAENQTFTPGEFANFTIYTPVIPPAPTCGGSPCASSPPQEFMTYNASEPAFLLILGVDLVLFGFAAMILRRRGILAAVR